MIISTRTPNGPPLVHTLTPSTCRPNERALFLDDKRDPPDDGRPWVVVRTVEAAQSWMTQHGLPHYVSFDHDLQQTLAGADLAQWMIEQDLDRPGALPADFSYFVHSQNGPGADNIVGKLDGYLKHRAVERGQPAPAPQRRATVGAGAR